jgi:prepilin-type N-terminal cleavage/methylation domain-containing protein
LEVIGVALALRRSVRRPGRRPASELPCFIMKTPDKHPERHRNEKAFTLTELLVVIAIIGILAGLLVPVLGIVKTKAKEGMTRVEMANLGTAIQHFESDYGNLPVSTAAVNAAAGLANPLTGAKGGDFTFGVVVKGTTSPLEGQTIISSTAISQNPLTFGSAYQNVNSEVISILNDVAYYPENSVTRHTYNSRTTTFFTARTAADTNSPGIDGNNILRDPWGMPYIVTLDLNGDGKCTDTGTWAKLMNTNAFSMSGTSMIWSFGYLRTVDLNNPSNPNNKHILTSWK